MGRPDKYKTHVEPYLEDIKKMTLTMSEEQIAQTLGVSYTSFRSYKKQYPSLVDALQKGRKDLVIQVKSALIQKAKGFKYTETKETYTRLSVNDELYHTLLEAGVDPEDLKELRWIRTEIMEKYSAPDVAACNLLLKNYDKDNWANDPQVLELRKQELELRKKHLEQNDW